MKKIYSLFIAIILFAVNSYSQPDPYKASQAQQKREWKETERHYEGMKPHTPYVPKTNNDKSTSSYNYTPTKKYSEADRKKYLEEQRLERVANYNRKLKEQQDAFNNKKEKFGLEMAIKQFPKNKSSYTAIINLATSLQLPDTFTYKVFGNNEQDFEILLNNPTANVHKYFTNPKRMMRPTGTSYNNNPSNNTSTSSQAPTQSNKKVEVVTNQTTQTEPTNNKNTSIVESLSLELNIADTIVKEKSIAEKLKFKDKKLTTNENSIYNKLSFDDDGDGVPNQDDLCPTIKGTVAKKGCL